MTLASRLALALAVAVTAAGASLVAVAAAAAPVPETGESGLLTLDADPYPAHDLEIAPGERVLWPLTARLEAPTSGELSVRVVATRPLAEDADALRFELASCPEPWVLPVADSGAATCAGGAGDVAISDSAFATTDAGEDWALGTIAPGVERYFLVTLALPLSTPGALVGEPAEVSFGFTARDPARPAAAAGLAATGGALAGPLLLAAGLLLGGGTVAAARRPRDGRRGGGA